MYYNTHDKSEIFFRTDLLTGITTGPMSRRDFLMCLEKDRSVFPDLTRNLDTWAWNYSGKAKDQYTYTVISEDDENFVSYVSMRYIFYSNGLGKIIDPRNYILESEKMQSNYHPPYNRGWWLSHKYGKAYDAAKFRIDPIPGTGNRSGRYRHLRHPAGVKRVRTYANDPEYGELFRNKANPFFSGFYESWREYQTHESWKKQKKRHQWEK